MYLSLFHLSFWVCVNMKILFGLIGSRMFLPRGRVFCFTIFTNIFYFIFLFFFVIFYIIFCVFNGERNEMDYRSLTEFTLDM